MEVLGEGEYEALIVGGVALKEMRQGVKVWRLADGRILKLFRRRGRFSRSRLLPPNRRFQRNAERLRELGFDTVSVERIFFCQPLGCFGLLYPALPGRTFEAVLAAAPADERARLPELRALAALIARLHQAGVLFRSLHLANVLAVNPARLALIDVEELTIRLRPLGVRARIRNFSHLLRRPQDRALLAGHPFECLLDAYVREAGLSAAAERKLRAGLDQPAAGEPS